MRQLKVIIAVLNFILISQISYAKDSFTVEDYGRLPEIRSVSISPDGKHYGYIQEKAGEVNFYIVNIAKNELITSLNVKKSKPTAIYFATNEHVILSRSRTDYFDSTFSNSFVYNIKTNKLKRLLRNFNNVNLSDSSGQAIGTSMEEKIVYVPAFMGVGRSTSNLLKVSLETGIGEKHAKGSPYTIDWFVDEDGNVLAREDYNDKTKEHSVYSFITGKWVKIFSETTNLIEMYIAAISTDKKELLFTQNDDSTKAIFSMSLEDGAINGPLFRQEGADVLEILKNNHNQEFKGVLYSGLLPNFQFEDNNLQSYIAGIQELFPTSAVRPVSITPDGVFFVLKISGNEGANQFAIFDTKTNNLKLITSSYPKIKNNDIANIKAIRYKSVDGTPINAIVTWPHGVEDKKNLPLLVYPHSGPERHNTLEFNWFAQYFARKGYMVLQPNFRGSSGFGIEFRDAGRGKWGKEMQDDITAGVNSMVKAGYVDPERVCIMGISYGGYAALAGGAFTPDLYKCVISIEGISDLPKFLQDKKADYGRDSSAYNYWTKLIGDLSKEKEELANRSPVNFAKNYKASLLLVYSKEDNDRVKLQSNRMQKALQKANKSYELHVLKGGGYWASDSEIRVELLQNISDFLDEHNPVIIH